MPTGPTPGYPATYVGEYPPNAARSPYTTPVISSYFTGEVSTQDIFLIWATDAGSDEPWLVAAWDEDSISENNEGWLEAVSNARGEYGGEYVRVTVTSVSREKVREAFGTPRV